LWGEYKEETNGYANKMAAFLQFMPEKVPEWKMGA
jgi:hypothetical protein